MALSAVSTTNKSVKFRGKQRREMSKADGLAALSPAFPKPKNAAKRVARKMKRLSKPARARGLISEKAMTKQMNGVIGKLY